MEHLETRSPSECFDGNSDNCHFSSNKEGKLVDLWNIPDISRRSTQAKVPKPR